MKCVEWGQYRQPNGYGRVWYQGKKRFAHRVAWMKFHDGRHIPEGMCVLHRCDNPPCVNPRHLFLGTHRDNVMDRIKKGRSNYRGQKGESNPQAKLTERKVQRIRKMKGKVRYADIAAKFGISFANVSAIQRRIAWIHV